MEKKRKALITVVTVILILIILLIFFSPNLTKRLTGEVSSSDNNTESEVVSNEFINEVCNISVDNENFMTVEGTIIMDEGKEGTATINFRSGDLVFTKEVTVKSNDYSSFTYILPRGEYSLTITKDGYKTYETNVSESKRLSITLVANKNKDIIASSKTHYNTYYDYYSDGTIHLKTVGSLNLESEEEFMAPDYFNTVLGDTVVKYLASNGYYIKPVSQGGEYDELGSYLVSLVYSLFLGAEANGTNYRNMFIEANNKIESGQCTKDNYMDDTNCEVVNSAFGLFSYGPSGALTYEENKEILKLILEIPLPNKLIIDNDVVVLPVLSGITSDEVTIGKNVMPFMDGCLVGTNIGTLTINSLYFNNSRFFAMESKINNLVIGDGISEIPEGAFKGTNIDNISLPNTIKEIGKDAFEDSPISAINLPDSVTKIGDFAFRNCEISNIKLPKSLVSIGDYAFSNSKLVSVTIPNTITSIGYRAFTQNDLNEVYFDTNADGSSLFDENRAESVKLTIGPNVKVVNNIFQGLKLTELNLSYGVKEISEYAFQNNNLITVVLPSSIRTIGEYAFSSNKLTSITIPKNVTSLGERAFYDNNLESIYFKAINLKTSGYDVFFSNNADSCNLIIESGIKVIPSRLFSNAKIASVEIPDSVTEIGSSAFANNLLTELPRLPKGIKTIKGSCFSHNKLTNVVIPYGIETIDYSAFSNNQIETLSIPSSVININDSAFSNNKLTTLSLPSSVTSIGSDAFSYNKLISVTIPKNVTNLGERAFYDNNLESIYFKAINLKTSGYDVFFSNNADSCNLIIESGVKVIPSRLFSNAKIASVEIPDSVTEIGSSAFANNLLTELPRLPKGIKTIGDSWFAGNKLTNVVIPYGIETIDYSAFSNNQIETLSIPSSVININDSAFSNNQIETLSIPSSVININDSAFSNNKLTTLSLPSSVTSIGNNAFNNNKLTSITIPKNVTSLGGSAFSSNNLESIYFKAINLKTSNSVFSNNKSDSCALTIESGVKVIPSRLFSNAKIASVEIPGSVNQIKSYAFENNKLANVVIPSGIKIIMDYAFYNNQIETLSIPNSVINIYSRAFLNNKLTEITIPESVSIIGVSAFANNPLTEITIMGDKKRFNSNWTNIGFPASLKPSS